MPGVELLPEIEKVKMRLFLKYVSWLCVFQSSRVQGFKGSRVQGFKGSKVQGFKGSKVQGFKGSSGARSRVSGFQSLFKLFTIHCSLFVIHFSLSVPPW